MTRRAELERVIAASREILVVVLVTAALAAAGASEAERRAQLPDCLPNVSEDSSAIHARLAAVQAAPAAVLPKIELARCFDRTWQFEHAERAIQQVQEALEAELDSRPQKKAPESGGLPLAGVDVPVPERVSGKPPTYPDDARAADAAGIVIVEARLDREGRVVNARAVRSIKGLDDAAIEAVKGWRFARPLVSTATAGVRIYLPIKFGYSKGLLPADYLDMAEFYYGQTEYQLLRGTLQLARMAVRADITRYGSLQMMETLLATPGFTAPDVVKRFMPQYTELAKRKKIQGGLEMLLLIDRQGVVGRASVVRPLPYLNVAGLEAAMAWTFTPGLLNGGPVSVIVPLELTFLLH